MSQSALPSVEIVQGPPGTQPAGGRGPGPRRVLTFGVVFAVITVGGMVWNFSRPALYRTAATVLTVKPKAVDARSAEADLEHVAIQGRALKDPKLLRSVAAQVNDQIDGADLTEADLASMLTWTPVEQTNLIELSAEGHEPAILTAAVNNWALAYEALRKVQIATAKAGTMAELEEEQATLLKNIRERQAALAAYREQHDIVSLESADNRAPAELKGLNAALNKARERLVEADAARASIDESIRQGKTVMPPENRNAYAALQLKAAKGRARLDKLETRFTQAYIDRDPTLRGLQANVEELDNDVKVMRELGQRQAVEQAEQTLAAARAEVADLEKRLREQMEGARTFARVFSEHEALVAEIAKLQQIHAANAERLAQIEARNVERYPPVQVIDRAGLPTQPVSPDYGRDAALVLAFAFIAAVLATWLVDYLGAQRQGERPGYTGVRVYPGDLGRVEPAPLSGQAAAARLAAPFPHVLLELAEAEALLRSADERTAAIAALLLSGVAPDEFALLDDSSFVSGEHRLIVPAPKARSIELGAGVRRRLKACREVSGAYPAGLSRADIDACLAIAALDAGLPDAARVSGLSLWHTYVVFLVRQGMRLADLPKQIGPVPSATLQAFARYSPPGQNQPRERIEPVFPLLRR